MSITNLYMLGPVVVAAGQINQIVDYAPDAGVEVLKHSSDGLPDPNFAAVILQSPRLNFTTTAVARALAVAGPTAGYAVAAAADFYFQKIAQGAVRTGGASSFRARATKGILVPQTLQCGDKGYARLTMALIVVSTDGEAAPLVMTPDVTMPPVTPADQLYTLGPVSINGTAVEGVKDVTIDFGLDVVVEHGSGEPYPTFAGIKARSPTATVRTTDPTALSAGGYFAGQGETDSLIHFWRCQRNGTRVARATAEHVRFAVDDGIAHARTIGGGDAEAPQMHELVIEPTFDGTNDTLAYSGASAIA